MDEIFSVGQWIKRRRKACDLTQSQLAERVGCSKELIVKIEADARRPSRQVAERLADQLGLAPDERPTFLQAVRAELGADRLAPPARSVPQPALASAARLPRGIVTFLFTDIEGSTQLWAQQPHKMGAAVARHEAILRTAIASAGGVVFKTVGDAVYAAFTSALDAVSAAVAGQRALGAEAWDLSSPLRVRMALHSGVVETRGGDYLGLPLSRVARLLAAGHGGQILLSLATVELVREQLPPDLTLGDLGNHRLKDLSLPEQIFQLVAPGLPSDFPPLQTLAAHRTNIQAQPTALIGRGREIADVLGLLRHADVRLVTLTGPGGAGKTRLALQAAAELLDEFADGVWFVNLAPISHPELVAPTIAQVLGVREVRDRPLLDILKQYLREKRMLLVLDNFEQVVGAALLVAALLAASPGLSVLVTSRIVLHLSSEHEYAVPSLALPERQHLPPAEQIAQYDSVRLFTERAQTVKPDFAVTNANARAVAEICERLDGLPLAIELAAKRSKLFAPEALLARLGNRLGVLTGGARDLPARQQTLRSTIDWSYQLLQPALQVLFRRLGIFVGGYTLEAAEAVCNLDDAQEIDMLDGLAALVDQSLLKQMDSIDRNPRFVLLETIREYALEQLHASGETAAIWQRHAAYYLVFAETAAPALVGREQIGWLARLDLEQGNVRAVLAGAIERNETELGLRLSVALRQFWIMRGLLSEGRRWLETLLASSNQPQVPGRIRADAQFAAGELAQWQNDVQAAIPLLEAALEWYRSAGDQPGIAAALHALGWMIWMQGDTAGCAKMHDESLARYRDLGDARGIATVLLPRSYLTAHWEGDFAQALAMAQESLHLFREAGDLHGIALALRHVGIRSHDVGRLEQATALVQEALRLARELGDKPGIMDTLAISAQIATSRGDLAHAQMLLEELLALAREIGHTRVVSAALGDLAMTARYRGNLREAQALLEKALQLDQQVALSFHTAQLRQHQGDLAYDQGDFEGAARCYRESLTIFWGIIAKLDCAACIEGLAAAAGAQGQAVRAARLWGSAAALREAIGAPLPPIDYARRDTALAALHAELGEILFGAAWSEGQALALEEAIAYALSEEKEAAA